MTAELAATGSEDLDVLASVPSGRALQAFHAAVRADPAFPAAAAPLVRARYRYLLGVDLKPAHLRPPDELTERCLGYAEQFLLDANGIDASVARPVAALLGDAGLVVFTLWLGLLESEERIRRLLRLAPGTWTEELDAITPAAGADPSVDPTRHPWPSEPDATPPSVQALAAQYAPVVADARAAVGAAAEGALPRRLAELVRLVAARSVDCRYCRNVRYRGDDGTQLVAEDDVAVLLDGPLDAFPPREATAIAFARAFFEGRGPLDPYLRAAWIGVFDPTERIELALVTMRNPAGSKAMIALGLVPAATPLTVL